jgi:translation initiation factor 3 subunit L
MESIKYVEFEPKGLYNAVPNCLVTLHFYVGFGHMMQRNYAEAIRIFVNCLLYVQRTRNIGHQQQKTLQFDVISKTNDQIYKCLAICLTLQPQRIDETIDAQLTEKMGDAMSRMQKGEISEFESCFNIGCPKFVCPILSQLDIANGTLSKEPINQQSRVFMEEIKQQSQIPILRGYLKLYSTMPLSKLAAFVDWPEEKLLSYLLSFKHKMFVGAKDSGVEVEDISDLDFYIDKDMIHIADTKVARRYGEYFIRHIQKLAELNKNLKSGARITKK